MSAPSLLSAGNLHHCNVLLESVPDVTSPPLLPSSLRHFLPNPRCKERPTRRTGTGIFFPCLHDVLRAAVTVFSGSFNPVLHVPFGATMKLATTRNEVNGPLVGRRSISKREGEREGTLHAQPVNVALADHKPHSLCVCISPARARPSADQPLHCTDTSPALISVCSSERQRERYLINHLAPSHLRAFEWPDGSDCARVRSPGWRERASRESSLTCWL